MKHLKKIKYSYYSFLALAGLLLNSHSSLASAYGEGSFNGCTYNDSCVAGLKTTGDSILLVSSIAILVLVAIAIVWFMMRRKKKKAAITPVAASAVAPTTPATPAQTKETPSQEPPVK